MQPHHRPYLDRWLAHVRHLAETIGPRGATTAEERRGSEYCHQTLCDLGLAARLEEFAGAWSIFRPHVFFALTMLVAFVVYPLAGRASAGTAVAIADARGDKRIHYGKAAATEGIRSLLVIPIPIRGRVRGVLRLLNRQPRVYGRREMDFVAAVAEQCGIAIENARIHDQQQRQLEYFKAVCEISNAIGETRQLDRILDRIVNTLPQVMDLKACTIRLIESSKGKMELKAAYGLSDSYLQRGPLDDEMATYFILKGEPVVIPDATSDIHTLYHREAATEGVGSVLAVPISIQEETIGMLRLLTAEQRFFSDHDINFAMAVAEQSGVAIQNAIDYQKMTDLLNECRAAKT